MRVENLHAEAREMGNKLEWPYISWIRKKESGDTPLANLLCSLKFL